MSANEIPDTELPGMWERGDFVGGAPDVVCPTPPSAAVPDPAANWASAYEAWNAVPREIVGHGRRLAFRAGWEAATERTEAAAPDPADEWCREESCRHRHWTSGSMPTHKRGAHCPSPSAPLAAARPSPDSEAVAHRHEATRLLIARAEGAAGALNAASHEVDNDEDAQLLARRAMQWEREVERYRAALGTGDREGQ